MKVKLGALVLFLSVFLFLLISQVKWAYAANDVQAKPASLPITYPITYPQPIERADLLQDKATFYLGQWELGKTYRIDLSTTPDMSWDVYLDFATGQGPAITTSNPLRWDKYSCGKTLYWRVLSYDRSYKGPINAASVKCDNPILYGTFSNLSATLNRNQAVFNFNYSIPNTEYQVDLSTTADMSWDVYLAFAKGSGNSLTINNPNKWDKYTCGRTLYFRVYNYNRAATSSIQSVTIQCQTQTVSTISSNFVNKPPVIKKTTVVNKTPIINKAPVIKNTPVVKNTPVAKKTPAPTPVYINRYRNNWFYNYWHRFIGR